jgi:hypothetical protein
LIIHLIIQTIGLDPSGAVWTDAASNVSRLDPSGAIPTDAEHPARNRKVEVRIPPRLHNRAVQSDTEATQQDLEGSRRSGTRRGPELVARKV